MQYLTAYGIVVELGQVERGDFVLITAASSSAGLAAIETTRAQDGQSIAITRKSDKRDELMASGANHVIALDEEDIESRMDQITNGKGVRIILDPGRWSIANDPRQGRRSRGHDHRIWGALCG